MIEIEESEIGSIRSVIFRIGIIFPRCLIIGILAIAVSIIMILWFVTVTFYWLVVAFALVSTISIETVWRLARNATVKYFIYPSSVVRKYSNGRRDI